jgi:hypothetical protein
MGTVRTPDYGPEVSDNLSAAFERAWLAVKDATTDKNRDDAREAIGKAIVGLAKTGYRNPVHLANYGAYQGRLFIDLRA